MLHLINNIVKLLQFQITILISIQMFLNVFNVTRSHILKSRWITWIVGFCSCSYAGVIKAKGDTLHTKTF